MKKHEAKVGPFATYRIRDMHNGLYQIHSSKGQAFEGTIGSIFKVGLAWGLDEEDMVQAVLELEERNHDYAEFGHFGRLIFTAQDGIKYAA